MPLIDHKGGSQIAGVDLVGAEKVQDFDIARSASGKNALHIAAARPRNESEIKTAGPRCGMVQNVEPVPIFANEATTFGDASGRPKDPGAVRPRERPLPHYNHRVLRVPQD